jgi:hypothetical protein
MDQRDERDEMVVLFSVAREGKMFEVVVPREAAAATEVGPVTVQPQVRVRLMP